MWFLGVISSKGGLEASEAEDPLRETIGPVEPLVAEPWVIKPLIVCVEQPDPTFLFSAIDRKVEELTRDGDLTIEPFN